MSDLCACVEASARQALKQERKATFLGVRIGYAGLGTVCSEKLCMEAVAANEASATFPHTQQKQNTLRAVAKCQRGGNWKMFAFL